MITARFPVAWCARCEREVMLYEDLDAEDALSRRCLHCDQAANETPNDAQRKGLKWLNADAAVKLGYAIEGVEPPPKKAGCGKPNCGQGRCKNSGKKHPFSKS